MFSYSFTASKAGPTLSIHPGHATRGISPLRGWEVLVILNPWFQLIASVISMVMIANLQYAWTLFVGPIQEAAGWKLAEVQLAFTIFINFQTFVQPIDGWFIDRMGPRKFITAAGVLCGVGWGSLAFA